MERRIRALNGPGADHVAGIARFLLRSEAIASSRIEGRACPGGHVPATTFATICSTIWAYIGVLECCDRSRVSRIKDGKVSVYR